MNGIESMLQAVDGVAYRVREIWIQQQEFNDPVGTDVRGVNLAIRFKRGTGPQQSNPFQIFGGLRRLIGMPPELEMVQTQQRDRGAGALHVAPHLDKVPA